MGPAPDRGLDTELNEPKYARVEFERRWLVDVAARPPLDGLPFTLIEDRYIAGTRMRLRRMASDARTVCKLTKKYETERFEARPVVTACLTEAEHAVLATLSGSTLRKRRFQVPVDGRYWSLDLFEQPLAGFALVEAEAADEAALAALVPPLWATKEVTYDPRYQCGSLAQTLVVPE